MKRAYYYVPLAIAILFGLAVSAIASSPLVYGDNVPGCQGSGSSTAKVILGGRVITPSTILRTANGQSCQANETAINMVSMIRTVVVSPDGTPTQNGTALLSAMNTISNASPSAANPWLLKLEPGIYDMGSNALALKPYVDLEGSGEGTTLISSTVASSNFPPAQGTLVMASNTEARFVKITNSGTSTYSTAILVGSSVSNAKVTHVTTTVAGSGWSYGLVNDGGKLSVQDSTLSATGSTDSAGIHNNGSTASLTVENSTLSSSGGSYSHGLLNVSGTVIIQNSSLSSTSSAGTYGLYTSSGTITVQNSNLSSVNNNGTADGIYTEANSVVTIQGSALSGAGFNGNGFYNTNSNSTIQFSTLNGTGVAGLNLSGYGVVNFSGTVGIGASQLSGSNGSALAYGTIKCVASYNASYAALSATCN